MKVPRTRALLAPLAVLAALALILGAGALSIGRGTVRGGPFLTSGAAGTTQPSAAVGRSAFGRSIPVAVNAQAARGTTTVPQPAVVRSAPQPIPVPQAFQSDRALILTASVALRADHPWAIADRVQAIASGLGGDVLQLSQSGSKDQHSATLTVRVPQAQFNDALRRIRGISDVEVVSSNVDGKDVTDQFVDLQARLKAKQEEEQRYLALLARADKVEDVIKIDSVLSQARTQIEELTGEIDTIKARTTYSTITVSISPLAPAPVPGPGPLAYDPSRTLQHAVTALLSMLRGVLDVAIWTAVFAWIPLVLFGLAFLVGRIHGRTLPAA